MTAPVSRAGYLTLVVALLVAGLHAGTFVRTTVFPERLPAAVAACEEEIGEQPADEAAFVAWFRSLQRCLAPATHLEAITRLAGAGAALVLGMVLMLALARRHLRRARGRPAPAWVRSHLAGIAVDAGLRRPPNVAIAALRVRSPYTAGRPGRTTIILPPGLLARPSTDLELVLRHEVAHIAAGDVTLVWFARGVWWAMIPVLGLPLLTLRNALSHGHWESTATFVAEHLARGAILLLVAAVLSFSVLRTREHEADLSAARSIATPPPLGMFPAAPAAGSPSPSWSAWWRLPFATHPAPHRRAAVLNAPELLAGPRPADTFCLAALLATTWFPLLTLATDLFLGTPLSPYATLTTAVASGVLLAATLGRAFWHQAIISASWPARSRGAAAAALVLGSLGGQIGSVALTSGGWTGPWARPVALFLPTALLVGAAGLVRAITQLWAPTGHGRVPARAATALVFTMNAVLFSGAVWFGIDLQLAAENGSPAYVLLTAIYLHAWTATVVLLTLGSLTTVRALVIRRARTGTWPVAAGASTAALTVAAVVAALLARWQIPPSPAWRAVDQVRLDWLIAAAAGAAAVTAITVFDGRWWQVRALVTGPATSLLTATALFLIANGSWNRWTFTDPLGAVSHYLSVPLAAVALAILALGLRGLTTGPSLPDSVGRFRLVVTVLAAAAGSGLSCAITISSGAAFL